jgi:hypothetical protein
MQADQEITLLSGVEQELLSLGYGDILEAILEPEHLQ